MTHFYDIYDIKNPSQYPGGQFWVMFLIALGIIIGFVASCSAKDFTNEQIAKAIWYAEGGNKTAHPYGIKSLKYENRTDKNLSKNEWARKICLNTIRNHRKRHTKHNCGMDFIVCLGARYCPTQGKHLTNDEKRLNKNWIFNVRYYLEKGAK